MTSADRVRNRIAETLALPLSAVADDARLTTLVGGSFRLVEMIIDLQEAFDVRFNQADLDQVRTAGELIELIVSRMGSEVR